MPGHMSTAGWPAPVDIAHLIAADLHTLGHVRKLERRVWASIAAGNSFVSVMTTVLKGTTVVKAECLAIRPACACLRQAAVLHDASADQIAVLPAELRSAQDAERMRWTT